MVTVEAAQWGSMLASATRFRIDRRFYIGGPRPDVASSTWGEGIALSLAAGALTAADIDSSAGTIQLTGTYSTLLPGPAVVSISGVRGENWFSYQSIITDTLQDVRRIIGSDNRIEAGAVVTQWRDISALVNQYEYGFETSGNEGSW